MPNLLAELTTWSDYGKFIGFPFKVLGFAALLLLFLLAATSHDFWLAFLTPPVWKWLHMTLYAAYGLVVMHVALGIMQYDRNPLIPLMLVAGFAVVTVLHLVAGWRERAGDRGTPAGSDGWIAVGAPDAIPDKCALIVVAPGGERIAVFRDGTADRRADQSLRAPERADRRGPHHRRLRDLSLARLAVSAVGRLRAAAVHRKARDLSGANQGRRRRGQSARAAARNACIDSRAAWMTGADGAARRPHGEERACENRCLRRQIRSRNGSV